MSLGERFEAARAAKERGEIDVAEAAYRALLAETPEMTEARYNLGNLLWLKGDGPGAAACFAAIPAGDDLHASARRNLGVALRASGRLEEARAAFDDALAVRPDDPAIKAGLAGVLSALGGEARAAGRSAAAIAALSRAVALDPHDPALWANLALCRLWAGDPAGALADYDAALARAPDDPEITYMRATVALSLGRWGEGWAGFEARLNCADTPLSRLTSEAPLWDGGPLAGRTILLWTEQGLGDAIQFLRFVAVVKDRGAGRVILACRAGLVPLVAGVPGLDAAVDASAPLPPHDVRLPLLSLPHRLGLRTADDLSMTAPTLTADPARAAVWRDRLGGGSGDVWIGLCWRGSAANPTDAVRSVAPQVLAPLVGIEGVRVISLQVGPGAEEAAALPDLIRPGEDFDADPNALFLDAAAIMRGLDLVVAVDTAVAHVAGALGVPVRLLLSTVPDWRWGHDGDSTPWYPAMRLVRQDRFGDWSGPVARIADELAAMVRRGRQ